MKRFLFYFVLSCVIAGCGSTKVSTGPSGGIGPLEVGLHLNSDGELEAETTISIPIVANKDMGAGINWDITFTRVLNEAQNMDHYLIVLWDENGSTKKKEFPIGQPFEINFEYDQWVRKIKHLDNGTIIVFVEKQELVQAEQSPPESPTPAKQVNAEQPLPQAESVKATRTTKNELNTLESIWDTNNITNLDLEAPGARNYQVSVRSTDRLLWAYFWCTSTEEVLLNNLAYLTVEFSIDDVKVPDSLIYTYSDGSANWKCKNWETTLDNWKSGETIQLNIQYNFSKDVFDGYKTYPSGEYRYGLTVSVK